MAYYFAVETTHSSFEAVNIKKTRQFKELFQSEEGYECTLEEIDRYTAEYLDESRLAHDLHGDRVLAWCHRNHPLSIIYVNGLEVRKVPGNLLFAGSKKYIENPNLTIDYIVQKAEEGDSRFFRELSLVLPENNVTTYMTSVLATSLEDNQMIENMNLVDKLKSVLNRTKNEDLIYNIAKSLVQFCYLDGEGKLEFSDTIDYEKFHFTVSFISEYEANLAKEMNNGPKRVITKQNTLKH